MATDDTLPEAPPQCPQCGRFVGEATNTSPGFGDAAWHDPTGCDDFEADVNGLEIFCNEACADKFHWRIEKG